MEIPMTLARQNETIKPLNRPQTPKAPFDYTTEEVSFQNIIDKKYLSRNAFNT
jgi:hypothetical protein